MFDRRTFAAWFRSLRLSKGFVSAAGLGRRAGVGASHVAMFERGEILPRWSTAEKLADGLSLSPEERAQFYAAIDEARKPDGIKAALAPLARASC